VRRRNRQVTADGSSARRRPSQSRWSRVMRRLPRGWRRSVDRGKCGQGIEPRKLNIQGADAVEKSGRQQGVVRQGEHHSGPARLRPLAPLEATAREPGGPWTPLPHFWRRPHHGHDLRWETMALVTDGRGVHARASIAIARHSCYRDIASNVIGWNVSSTDRFQRRQVLIIS
jgi:hypothetical protein